MRGDSDEILAWSKVGGNVLAKMELGGEMADDIMREFKVYATDYDLITSLKNRSTMCTELLGRSVFNKRSVKQQVEVANVVGWKPHTRQKKTCSR